MPNEVSRSKDGRYVQLEGISGDPIPYWDDPRIHNFGNNSWISATFAPVATKIIDVAAYDGINLRKKIYQEISPDLSVVDLCCGAGMSTVPWGTGVDTSDKFLQIARFRAINIPRMT